MRPSTELAIIQARSQGHELTDSQRRELADSTARLIARALGRLDSAGEWDFKKTLTFAPVDGGDPTTLTVMSSAR